MAGRAFMKFRRKSKHPDSPCPPELFPNIDLTTLCQVWHLVGVHSTPYFVVLFQDGGVDEADEASPCSMPLHLQTALQPAFRVPILSTSSGFGPRGKYCNTEAQKERNTKKGGNRNPYTPLGTSSCIFTLLTSLSAESTGFSKLGSVSF